MTDEFTDAANPRQEGPLYGWRSFRVNVDTSDYVNDVTLTSLFYRSEPNARTLNPATANGKPIDLFDWNEADVKPRLDDGTPERPMQPGFHVFHSRPEAAEYAAEIIGITHQLCDMVIAKVEIQGVVVEHEKGFRAERIRLVEIEHPNPDPQVRINLATGLGWPFEIKYVAELDTKLAQELRNVSNDNGLRHLARSMDHLARRVNLEPVALIPEFNRYLLNREKPQGTKVSPGVLFLPLPDPPKSKPRQWYEKALKWMK